MAGESLETMFQDAVWVAHSLFGRGKATGSSANISFRYGDTIFISASGTCFGRLLPEDFVRVTLDGKPMDDQKPSKELPLHLTFYQKDKALRSVIHTHGPFATLLSCIPCEDPDNAIRRYTPYLTMKAGCVVRIPYAAPGSEELYAHMRAHIHKSNTFLLASHGAIVGARTIMDAFYILEELEESAKIQYHLSGWKDIPLLEG